MRRELVGTLTHGREPSTEYSTGAGGRARRPLLRRRNILAKSRVPHEAFLLAGLFEVLFNFAVRAAVALPVFLWLRTPPTAASPSPP